MNLDFRRGIMSKVLYFRLIGIYLVFQAVGLNVVTLL